jgi:hypothetical protein
MNRIYTFIAYHWRQDGPIIAAALIGLFLLLSGLFGGSR